MMLVASWRWRPLTLVARLIGGLELPGDVDDAAWFAEAWPLPTLFHLAGCKLLSRGASLMLAKSGSWRCTGPALSPLSVDVPDTDMVVSSATIPNPIEDDEVDIAARKGLGKGEKRP